ncbi:glucosamine-6-phosphate deaminase [Shewanella nanhaiensis]|uniref:Glucosamine-6-phosphate deaminase n=1 Tax=Shewanella nanhaiensis TaxID=2864872 RepID=A0ABS7E703_9GAMM|nr:glucosamine-6-phosphate deaminase [Shewanella nanhaiensis]MBW8185359.1 glucosamine-6-phosphate deaminase [Shewanella nanhaiensis]
MQVIILNSASQVAVHAALRVKSLIDEKPDSVLGLATGSTPIALYKQLVNLYRKGELSFAQVKSFNLDEYFDIAPDNPQSYRYFMTKNLFKHIDIDHNNTYLPTCFIGQNPRVEAAAFEKNIQLAGGVDLQILGLGANGHIGFNEPTSSLGSRTRVKSLTPQTIKDNSRLFEQGEYQPDMAMTMGIATILDSRNLLLMATGLNKAKAVKQMITGPLSAMCPASALQMHRDAVVLLDREAASELDNTEYFSWVNEQNTRLNNEFGFYS